MSDDLHSLAREIEALDEAIADANADKAEVYQRAKKVLREDLPAFRAAMAERRKRDKNPAAYSALKGRAAELLDALDNGVIIGHARAPARAPKKSEAPTKAATAAIAGEREVTAPDAASDTPIPEPPAGGTPQPDLPKAVAAPPSAIPAGGPDPDEHWEKRDGHDSYVLALQVANGKLPHPADASHIVPIRPDRTAVDAPLEPPAFLKRGTVESDKAMGKA